MTARPPGSAVRLLGMTQQVAIGTTIISRVPGSSTLDLITDSVSRSLDAISNAVSSSPFNSTSASFAITPTSIQAESSAADQEMLDTTNQGGDDNRTLIITLSTIFSVIAFLLIVSSILLLWRLWKQRGRALFNRAVTPIDDDEIETWKGAGRRTEKGPVLPMHRQTEPSTASMTAQSSPRSVSSKKSASVIVYTNTHTTVSGEGSPKSVGSILSSHFRKQSMDVPPTPVLAKAPNSRPGLCDDAVPGADPFVTPIRRQPSRLSKLSTRGAHHVRSKSSRSSIRSLGCAMTGTSPQDHNRDWIASGYHTDGGAGEHVSRSSIDFFENSAVTRPTIFSSTSCLDRYSLADEVPGGLSPPPPVIRGGIGRAIS